MQNLNSYFLSQGLFDTQLLKEHCDRHFVKYITSPRLPHLVQLHYSDECQFESLWDSFNTRCRGTVVDLKNKKILNYPFDKFFNIEQKGAPSYDELVKLGPFVTTEKLDGTMIVLVYDRETNQYLTFSKGSLDNEFGTFANQFVPESLKDSKLLEEYSLVFELIWYENKVVIDYSQKGVEQGLVLTGVRHNKSEKLLSVKETQGFADKHSLRTFKTYFFNGVDQVVTNVKELPFSEEGYVLRWDEEELLLKVKSPAYLAVHRFLSGLNDKNLLELLIEGKDKEALDTCPEEYRNEVISALENYRKAALELRSQVYTLFAQAPKETRKEFALWVKSNVQSDLQKYLFTLIDQKPLELVAFYRSFHRVRKPSLSVLKVQVPSLVIMVGTSGSGKSYLASKLFPNTRIISSDNCREHILWHGNPPEGMSSETYWTKMQGVSYQAFQMFHREIDQVLGQGQLAVADATSLRPHARNELEQIAARHKVPVSYIVVATPENLCIERDASRKYPVGMTVIDKQTKILDQVMSDLSGKNNVTFVTPKNSDLLGIELVSSQMNTQVKEEVKKDTILCDLDGTLADITHRLHYVQNRPANWDAFFMECTKDVPKPWCVNLLKAMMAQGYKVLIVSARSQVVEKESRKWLDDIGLSEVELVLVRPEGNTTADQLMKKTWLYSSGLKNRVLFVVDDRQKVVDMWREEGLTCLQCDKWEERKK